MAEDTKTDFIALKELMEGKADKERLKEKFSIFKQKDFWNMVWIALLCLITAFVLGWWVASKYYEVQCQALINNVIEQARSQLAIKGTEIPEGLFNFT